MGDGVVIRGGSFSASCEAPLNQRGGGSERSPVFSVDEKAKVLDIPLGDVQASPRSRGWGGDGKSCPGGRCQGQFCLAQSIIEPFAVGEAILFNRLLQSRPYSLVVTRLVCQPLVEKPDGGFVLGSLRHPFRFYSMGWLDMLLFFSQEANLLLALFLQPAVPQHILRDGNSLRQAGIRHGLTRCDV